MNNYEEFFINIFQSKIITLYRKGFLNDYQRHFVAETSGEAHVKRQKLLAVCLFRDIYGQKKIRYAWNGIDILEKHTEL